jgi:hypothetical protein
MSGVLIVAPIVPALVVDDHGAATANLLTPDPKEIWLANTTSTVALDVDMGSAQAIDSFFLAYTNATVGATWALYSATGMGTGLTLIRAATAMRASDSLGPRHHAFVRLAAPVSSRYFRLVMTQSGPSPLQAGALVLGLAFEKYREYGGGRLPFDTGNRQDLISGGFGMGDGVTKAQFAFSFIDLSDDETVTLWALSRAAGLRKPIVVIEDADLVSGRNEAIHYGVFERFQPYERQEANSTRWAFSHIEWV